MNRNRRTFLQRAAAGGLLLSKPALAQQWGSRRPPPAPPAAGYRRIATEEAWAPAALGVDQVLYAMDYPYQYRVEEVHAMDALPIAYEDKKQFFQTNAERVFNLV